MEVDEQVYPCRCGKVHKGDYAIYEYGHHNCFHEDTLLGFVMDKGFIQAICPQCGMVWMVKIMEE